MSQWRVGSTTLPPLSPLVVTPLPSLIPIPLSLLLLLLFFLLLLLLLLLLSLSLVTEGTHPAVEVTSDPKDTIEYMACSAYSNLVAIATKHGLLSTWDISGSLYIMVSTARALQCHAVCACTCNWLVTALVHRCSGVYWGWVHVWVCQWVW